MSSVHPIGVDKAFEVVVRRLGGAPFTDLVPETGNLPRNADFVFKQWNLIAELKRLENPYLGSPGLKQRIGQRIALWRRQGVLRLPGGKVNLQEMPQKYARELTSMMKRKLEAKVVKPASDQIKSARNLLQMPDALGLLIVAHEGNRDMTPELAMHLLALSLHGTVIHSGIDCVIYLSPNVPVKIAGRGEYLPWLVSPRSDARRLPDDFLLALQTGWIQYHQELLGAPLATVPGTGIDAVASMERLR